MSVFDVDYNQVVWQMLPNKRRRAKRVAWLRSLLSPLISLWSIFMINRKANLYKVAHNGQVCYLEAALNDTFDNISRGIYISDGVYVDPIYIYQVLEEKPVPLYTTTELLPAGAVSPIPLYTDAEVYTGGGVAFIVNVPVAVPFDVARMKALVNFYKLPARSYSIVTF